jgi:putative transposase
VYLKLAEI